MERARFFFALIGVVHIIGLLFLTLSMAHTTGPEMKLRRFDLWAPLPYW